MNLPLRYIEKLADALVEIGAEVLSAWMDPSDPRDATIVFSWLGGPLQGLLWDEETGLRVGGFIAGRQGERTRLADPRHLGGGPLPEPEEVIDRLIQGVREPRVAYRSYTDREDGFDDLLGRFW